MPLLIQMILAWSIYFIDFPQVRLYVFCSRDLSVMSTLQNTRSANGGSLRNGLTLIFFEDLLHRYSRFKIHAFSLEL